MRRRRPTLEEKVEFLRRRSTYGGGAGTVRCIETHFAWVFLVGRHAYKLKKPLRHKQMNYRSLAARERGCREELRLNQRLASSVYRSVVPLTVVNGHLSLNKNGAVVDWLIKMRRLPDSGLLDHALRARRVRPAQIQGIARRLARFYRQARPWPVSARKYLARFRREILENRSIIRSYGARLPQRLAQEVCAAQLRALEALRSTLSARAAHIVEGHGDLRAEHVFLGPPITIIDSLEFDPALRQMDPAEEVSLLALEIERLQQRRLADLLVSQFCSLSRLRQERALFAFYKSHRAATRAKLAAWHLDDVQFPNPAPWIRRTKSLLDDAYRCALAAQ